MRPRALSRRAQSTMETAILLLVIIAALIAMQVYIKRGIQGRLRSGVDSLGGQYDPAATISDYTTQHVSNSTTTTTIGEQEVTVPQPYTWYYVPPITMNVTATTTRTEVHYDNTISSGYESVAAP